MSDIDKPAHFAAHCEIQDAMAGAEHVFYSPGAATVEFAKLLTKFDDQIDDEWRDTIIRIGGALASLDTILRNEGRID